MRTLTQAGTESQDLRMFVRPRSVAQRQGMIPEIYPFHLRPRLSEDPPRFAREQTTVAGGVQTGRQDEDHGSKDSLVDS